MRPWQLEHLTTTAHVVHISKVGNLGQMDATVLVANIYRYTYNHSDSIMLYNNAEENVQ